MLCDLLGRRSPLHRLEFVNLSPQQTAVLKLRSEGKSHKLIAAKLRLSIHTVKGHMERARSRLACPTTIEAVILFASMRGRRK